MPDKDDRTVLNFDIAGEHGAGKLRVVIPWFSGDPSWQATPAHLIGAFTGVPWWKASELGLYSHGGGPATERPFAVLVAPEGGFDEAPIGDTGLIHFHDGKRGTWTKTRQV